ncbi:hypothetical protein [Rhizobium laguerreae]|uniref:Uncharacterized protein n=1 Tax=Rhizobium laguerreae TaxID=1076926 RepID=A0A7Y2R9U7_9HYPH|nr:hypothetical protein [Rhizobium laguerreae]NNH66866.1 hypothetical protein [Rhizobium laguerreae]
MTLLSLSSGGEASPTRKGCGRRKLYRLLFSYGCCEGVSQVGWLMSSALSAFFPLLDYRDVGRTSSQYRGKIPQDVEP